MHDPTANMFQNPCVPMRSCSVDQNTVIRGNPSKMIPNGSRLGHLNGINVMFQHVPTGLHRCPELRMSHGAPTHHIRSQSPLRHRRKPGQCQQPAGSQQSHHLATTFGARQQNLWVERSLKWARGRKPRWVPHSLSGKWWSYGHTFYMVMPCYAK